MLKFVVVGSDRVEEEALADLAHQVAERCAGTVRIVAADGRGDAERLDEALFERPLASQLVVVGRDASCDLADLGFLVDVLSRRWDLAAVTTGGDVGPSVADVVTYGGAFRPGPLCQAGGFAGDGQRSLHDRLGELGFRSAVRGPVPVDAVDVSAPWWRSA